VDKRVIVVVSLVNSLAIPALAFLIRMAAGDTRSENEEIISRWMLKQLKRYTDRTQLDGN
jgi:hypothetical protein